MSGTWIARVLTGTAALALAAGCGVSDHSHGTANAGPVGTRASVVPTSAISSTSTTVGSTQPAGDLAAVQSDLADAGSAEDQASTDVSAATNAQAQDDSP
jgi:hypothetical protein